MTARLSTLLACAAVCAVMCGACREPVPELLLPLLPPELDLELPPHPEGVLGDPEGVRGDPPSPHPEGVLGDPEGVRGDPPSPHPEGVWGDPEGVSGDPLDVAAPLAASAAADPATPAGAAALGALLAHPDLRVRRAAVTRFAHADAFDAAGIDALAARLDDEQPVVRQLAAQALARAAYPAGHAALVVAYRAAEPAEAVVLALLLARVATPEALAALGDRALAQDDAAADAAIEALWRLGPAAVPALTAAASAPGRACAAQLALARLGAPATPITAELERDDLCALAPPAARGDAAALGALVAALASPDAVRRDRAALVLSAARHPAAFDALVAAHCASAELPRPSAEMLAHALATAAGADPARTVAALLPGGSCAAAVATDRQPLLDWLAEHASTDHLAALTQARDASAPGAEREALSELIVRLQSTVSP